MFHVEHIKSGKCSLAVIVYPEMRKDYKIANVLCDAANLNEKSHSVGIRSFCPILLLLDDIHPHSWRWDRIR